MFTTLSGRASLVTASFAVLGIVAVLGAGLGAAGCDETNPRPCGVCWTYGPVEAVGSVTSPAVNELSGIAASERYDNVYYAEDDDPVPFEGLMVNIHALDDTGKLLAHWALADVRVGNLEDIDVGPCPAGSCIYTGDVGNNSGDQSPYPMYRIPEPMIDRNAPPTTSTLTGFDTIHLEYPDGAPRDCEGFVVHPITGDIYLIEKKTGSHAAVFKVPPWPEPAAGNDPTLTMTYVGEISLVPDGTTPEDQQIVGADIHPCGSKMLVRTYSHVYEYTLPAGAPFEAIFGTTPVKVRNPGSSESIAYLWDGLGYLSVPEGVNPPLTVVRCEDLVNARVP